MRNQEINNKQKAFKSLQRTVTKFKNTYFIYTSHIHIKIIRTKGMYIEHLRKGFLAKIVNGQKPLAIFAKSCT